MLVVGTISTTSGVFGSATNTPAAISVGFTTDNPPKVNNVVEVVAGVATAFSASASGTFTVTAAPSGGGTTPGTGPTALIKFANGTNATPGTAFQVSQSPLLLDGTGSTGSGALTFAWSTTTNSPVAFVATGTTGQILVQFPSAGDYVIKLTVTDSTGASNSTTVTVSFTGRPQ
jgi:hypothetical protein